MLAKHAVGILVKDRWDFTEKTLHSLYYSNQSKSSYDLFVINNGSDKQCSLNLKSYVQNGLLPIKNLIVTPELSIAEAWNLFLGITDCYKFRTKLDNDIVLSDTIPIKSPSDPKVVKTGSPTSMSIIKGIGQFKKVKHHNYTNSCFLDQMVDFSSSCNADIVGLVCPPLGVNFGKMYQSLIGTSSPSLITGCMMISKTAFDKIGYFDESLPRNVNVEYTRRAIKNGVNIGYHPYYGAIHIGSSNHTEPAAVYQQKVAKANSMMQERAEPKQDYIVKFDKFFDKIKQQCNMNKIVNIE